MKNTLPFLVILASCYFESFAQNNMGKEMNAFLSKTHATVSVSKATNTFNFLKFPAHAPLKLSGISTAQKAFSFISSHADLFHKAGATSYQAIASRKDIYGLEHVVLQQYYNGVPVYDGILKFHFDKKRNLTSVNGNHLITGQLNTIPSVSKKDAEQWALKYVTRQKRQTAAPLKISKSTLYVFQKGLVQGYQGPLHLVYEIEIRNDADLREFLYVDAHSKQLVEQFTGLHSIDRCLYETSVSPANLKWQESDGIAGQNFAALSQWQKSEVESAGHIYHLMKNAFGYDSYDNAGASMITIHNNPSLPCPNASWNGVTTNFCPGMAADDIVGHEWGHAYTEYTTGLIYAWQPGAINEALSDIWGETIDQLNGYFDGGESNALRNGCASSARWRIGEQQVSTLRDMWDPTCKDQPGKVSDPLYQCTDSDNGAVHLNSGVVNHAYALLVDGGSYNGETITGLGLTKAAHIFWKAQSSYITSTTDFASLADILEASLTELVGINLPKLATDGTAGLSGIMITASDAEQLGKVIAAVELRHETSCNFQPLFEPVGTLCSGALPSNAIFLENFEADITLWTIDNAGGSASWIPRSWVIDDTPPGGRNGKVAFADNFKTGNCVDNLQNGLLSLTSPLIIIPVATSPPLTLAFDHYVSLQHLQDGGNLKYKIGSGAWMLIPKSAFIENGYNSNISVASSDNPLKGQDVFSGANAGAVLSAWGQSQVNLTALGLLPGQTIQFRWELGTDGCGSWDGWYIDDVKVYSCALPSIQFVEGSSNIKETEANTPLPAPNECVSYVEKTITVKINQAPSQPVTVVLNVPAGTATNGAGSDYTITPASFVLDAAHLSKDIVIRVYNDSHEEGDETLELSYSFTNPPGGNAIPETFFQQHKITIIDDDVAPKGNGTEDMVTADFNSGLPVGWKIIGGGTFPETWGIWDNLALNLDQTGTPLLSIDGGYCAGMDKIIETNAFSSLGMNSINLSFLEYFNVLANNSAEQALVDVWDGTVWQNVLTQNESTGSSGSWDAPFLRNINLPTAYSNSAMKLRFRYITSDYDGSWAIDNIKVTGSYATALKTTTSVIPDSKHLAPYATVFFNDPASGELIAKIKNLSSHDYGCTTVEVDRAGNDEIQWVANYKITKKTVKVNPANDSPTGSYEITLFFKPSELPNFNGAAIKSMGKSEGGIAGSTLVMSSSCELVSSAFYSDLAFTSTFNSGFGNLSSFGLSDAPPIGYLPVVLVRFEGKHSKEGNVLSWETSSEVNNSHFVVERSRDARQFYEISVVAGAGTSNNRNTYSFTDSDYIMGISYYRLKQIDKDGSFAHSRVISIAVGEAGGLSYFPNPVQNELNIEAADPGMKKINLKIFNVSGQCVLEKEGIGFKKGKLLLDMEKFSPGIYQVVVSGVDRSHCFSVVKIP